MVFNENKEKERVCMVNCNIKDVNLHFCTAGKLCENLLNLAVFSKLIKFVFFGIKQKYKNKKKIK